MGKWSTYARRQRFAESAAVIFTRTSSPLLSVAWSAGLRCWASPFTLAKPASLTAASVIARRTAGAPGFVTVSILSDAAGAPGASLFTSTAGDSDTWGLLMMPRTFGFTQASLSQGVPYWFAALAPGSVGPNSLDISYQPVVPGASTWRAAAPPPWFLNDNGNSIAFDLIGRY